MKLFRFLCAFLVLGFAGFADAVTWRLPTLQSNPNTIKTVNSAGFSAPPSTAAPWDAGSYVPIQASGTGSQTVWISVVSNSGVGTLHLYTSLDGKTNLIQDNDATITNCSTGAMGAISAASSGLYAVQLPPGVSYLGASAWSGGTVSVFAIAGSGTTLPPGQAAFPLPVGASTSANQATLISLFPPSLASGGLKTNGVTILTTYSGGGEASNTVTSSAAALTLSGGSDPSSPIFVIVTNAGTVDAWASPVSGGHTWIIPAGSTVYLPVGATALYGLSSGANTTLYCIKAGY